MITPRHRMRAMLLSTALLLSSAHRPAQAQEVAGVRSALPEGTRAALANESLASAHAAYIAGALPEAGRLYAEALQSAPGNPDALMGLGMVALRNGLPTVAARHFSDILAIEPEHPAALAALSNLRPGAGTVSESRLRQTLAEQPDAAALHFALGNLLARQQRWAAAQRAYLAAHERAPDDADALFNLAVSLEHLGRPTPAAHAYRQALDAAAAHPAAFDQQQALRRLESLTTPTEHP